MSFKGTNAVRGLGMYVTTFTVQVLNRREVTYSDKTEQLNALCLCRHFVLALLNDVMTAGHRLVLRSTVLFFKLLTFVAVEADENRYFII